jgi:SNF2 family DNA or RNA helicase
LDVLEEFLILLKGNSYLTKQRSPLTCFRCITILEPFLRLDGQTSNKDRDRLVTKFQNPACRQRVFIISTRAGGLGNNNKTTQQQIQGFDC